MSRVDQLRLHERGGGTAWPREHRVLVLAVAAGVTGYLIADANPWNFVVLSDQIRPAAGLVTVAATVALLRTRCGLTPMRLAWDVALTLPVVLRIPAVLSVLTGGLVMLSYASLILYLWMNQAGRHLVAQDPATGVSVEARSTLSEMATPSSCSGGVFLSVDRGMASRREKIAEPATCIDLEATFPEHGVVVLHSTLSGEVQRIEFDPRTLDVLHTE